MIDDILKPGELAELGRRLRTVREVLNLKQKKLAEVLGLSAGYVSDIEKGKTNPGFNFLLRLYREYHVSLDWLLFDEGEMFCGKGAGDRSKLSGFDFGQQTGQVLKLLEQMEKSPFLVHFMLSQYFKCISESESVIAKDLEKHQV